MNGYYNVSFVVKYLMVLREACYFIVEILKRTLAIKKHVSRDLLPKDLCPPDNFILPLR